MLKLYARDFIGSFAPKSPSPRKPETKIDQSSYQRGHDDGWNAAVAFYKGLGKI